MNYFADWCIEQHKKTNHFYDDYLPYEFHLRMVHNVFLQFSHLLDDKISLNKSIHTLRSACENAVWGQAFLATKRSGGKVVHSGKYFDNEYARMYDIRDYYYRDWIMVDYLDENGKLKELQEDVRKLFR